MSGGPVFRWPSPSPAACEPVPGVDVLLGRFLREHGLAPCRPMPVSASSRVDLIMVSSTYSCLWLRIGWPVCSIRAVLCCAAGSVSRASSMPWPKHLANRLSQAVVS